MLWSSEDTNQLQLNHFHPQVGRRFPVSTGNLGGRDSPHSKLGLGRECGLSEIMHPNAPPGGVGYSRHF
jgi:hypothetical protein